MRIGRRTSVPFHTVSMWQRSSNAAWSQPQQARTWSPFFACRQDLNHSAEAARLLCQEAAQSRAMAFRRRRFQLNQAR